MSRDRRVVPTGGGDRSSIYLLLLTTDLVVVARAIFSILDSLTLGSLNLVSTLRSYYVYRASLGITLSSNLYSILLSPPSLLY